MFLKSKKNDDKANLPGVITFFGSSHALRAESILKKNKKSVKLIPGPREISPNCGVALRFKYTEKDEVHELLSSNNVLFENIHYHPEI
jgi:hypothetical protein